MLLQGIDLVIGLRIDAEIEHDGLDGALHGESAYGSPDAWPTAAERPAGRPSVRQRSSSSGQFRPFRAGSGRSGRRAPGRLGILAAAWHR